MKGLKHIKKVNLGNLFVILFVSLIFAILIFGGNTVAIALTLLMIAVLYIAYNN